MQQKIIKYVATNDRGMRIGESHHNCKIKDCVVDQIRDMHEDEGIGYRTIAKRYWPDLDEDAIAEMAESFVGEA